MVDYAYATNTAEWLHQRQVADEAQDVRLDALEAEMLLRTKWMGRWVSGTTYEARDQVLDDGWLMIANKQTVDRPAPQPSGDLSKDLPDTPAFADSQHTGVVWSGTEYTLTQGGWVNSVEVWAPELTVDTTYRVIFVDRSDPANPVASTINEPVLVEDGWALIVVKPTPFPAGTVLEVYLDALNSGTETVVSGEWTRANNTNSQTNNPGLNSWGTRNNENQLRINKTDLDTVDRTTELGTISAGSVVSIVDTTDATKFMSWVINAPPVDNAPGDSTGHYYWPDLTFNGNGPNGPPDVGENCTITAQVPTPAPTKYAEIAAHWPTNQPAWGTLRGLLRYDGVDQVADDSAFGVRIEFQPAYVSPDWDIQAIID